MSYRRQRPARSRSLSCAAGNRPSRNSESHPPTSPPSPLSHKERGSQRSPRKAPMAHSEDSNTPHETQPDDAGDMGIGGLRPPRTRGQRRRRIAMSALVVAGALAVLLWPAISAFQIALPSLPYVARATATPNHSPRWSGGIAVTTLEI